MIRPVDLLFWYIPVSIFLQCLRSFFGDSPYLSATNILVYSLLVMAIFLKIDLLGRRRIILFFIMQSLIIVPIVYWSILGKRPMVLIIGHLDNMKFIFIATLLIMLPDKFFIISDSARRALKVAWWLIVVGIALGLLQQFFSGLITSFPNMREFNFMQRYGITRVPSYFSEINAFARVGFLLVPISFLLGKSWKIALILSLMSFILAFSRQMILGVVICFVFAYMQVALRRFTFSIRVIAFSLVCVCVYIGSMAIGGLFSTDGDDKLFSISERYIRTSVAITSINAVADNPIFGVGPGYFGGNIGKKFNVTEDLYGYGLLDLVPYFDLSGKYYTDTLWPQILAEYGIPGFLIFASVILLWVHRVSKNAVSDGRFIGVLCAVQLIISGMTSPVFNFLYFTIPILTMSLAMINMKPKKDKG